MNKQKKTALIALSALCVVLISLGIFFGVRAYFNHKNHFSVQDTLPSGEGKKATVILLAGQSNASGCSLDEYLRQNVSEEQYAAYEAGYDNVYINYFVSATNVSQGFVKCATQQGEGGGHFGPELGLAQKLHELYPNEQFFIIKYAFGGTNLYEEWLSPTSKGKTGKLYKEFAYFVEANMKYLISKNYDVEIEGMCWMQGESDSFSTEHAGNYGTHLSNFIKDVRKEFSRYAAKDGIVFVDAYIADNPTYWVYCDIVNDQKQKVATASDMNVVIDTVGAGLSCAAEPTDAPDLAHYDSLSEIKLGHLFAQYLAPFL